MLKFCQKDTGTYSKIILTSGYSNSDIEVLNNAIIVNKDVVMWSMLRSNIFLSKSQYFLSNSAFEAHGDGNIWLKSNRRSVELPDCCVEKRADLEFGVEEELDGLLLALKKF